MPRLVISRAIGETLVGRISAADLARLAAAGEPLELRITPVKRRGGRSGLAIDAPAELRLVREEIDDGRDRRRAG